MFFPPSPKCQIDNGQILFAFFLASSQKDSKSFKLIVVRFYLRSIWKCIISIIYFQCLTVCNTLKSGYTWVFSKRNISVGNWEIYWQSDKCFNTGHVCTFFLQEDCTLVKPSSDDIKKLKQLVEYFEKEKLWLQYLEYLRFFDKTPLISAKFADFIFQFL